MSELQTQNVLMLPVLYNGREYITSHRLHADYKAMGGEKYISVSEFNRMIRSIEAYPDYLIANNIIEISSQSQVIDLSSNAEMALLIKSNSYKPVMLLDKAANIAIMNFLENEASRKFSVQGNTYLAEKLTAGPSLEDFLARTQEFFRTSMVNPVKDMCKDLKTEMKVLHQELSGDVRDVKAELNNFRQSNENRLKLIGYEIDKLYATRRRGFSSFIIKTYIQVITIYYSRKCPCCQETIIVDSNNQLIRDASEKDHFHGRHLNKAQDGWIICLSCHKKKTSSGQFARKCFSAFEVFQLRLADMPEQQNVLPGIY